MNAISYAQNYEDVMLWRALKHVKKGFYIDVGAWSPDIDSVTRFFYENNWRGINVEPNPEFHAQYETRRPEDISLRVAVGDCEGSVLINFISNPGLSTVVDQFAKQHESAGWAIHKQEVPLTTLASICKQHVEKNQDIHFLKVDVEGLEGAVLRGNEWSIYRPWVVLVEATLPMTEIESYQEWEPILINAEYAFVYADGLNRFYVANEQAELMKSFKYPPNVFDNFLLSSQKEAEVKAQQAEVKAQQAEVKAQQAEVKAQQAEVKAQQAEVKAQQAEAVSAHHIAQLQMVYTSKSWRVTAPLRWLYAQARRLRAKGLKSRIKSFIKKALRKIDHELLVRPTLRLRVLHSCRKLGLYDALKLLNAKAHEPHQNSFSSTQDFFNQTTDVQSLSPRARQIYGDLMQAIEQQKIKIH